YSRRLYDWFCFFFFQAEDGIRDFHVTGVQTCALPISGTAFDYLPPDAVFVIDEPAVIEDSVKSCLDTAGSHYRRELDAGQIVLRSEERRVGKECRWRWWRYKYETNRGISSRNRSVHRS